MEFVLQRISRDILLKGSTVIFDLSFEWLEPSFGNLNSRSHFSDLQRRQEALFHKKKYSFGPQ